jgi:hypothetical protein
MHTQIHPTWPVTNIFCTTLVKQDQPQLRSWAYIYIFCDSVKRVQEDLRSRAMEFEPVCKTHVQLQTDTPLSGLGTLHNHTSTPSSPIHLHTAPTYKWQQHLTPIFIEIACLSLHMICI